MVSWTARIRNVVWITCAAAVNIACRRQSLLTYCCGNSRLQSRRRFSKGQSFWSKKAVCRITFGPIHLTKGNFALSVITFYTVDRIKLISVINVVVGIGRVKTKWPAVLSKCLMSYCIIWRTAGYQKTINTYRCIIYVKLKFLSDCVYCCVWCYLQCFLSWIFLLKLRCAHVKISFPLMFQSLLVKCR